jgi:alanine transaminase
MKFLKRISVSKLVLIQVGYYLNEDKNWALDISELERSLKEAKKCCNPRAIVIINPGNPTGKITTFNHSTTN